MTESSGRCEECGCIPRPDIARAKGEKHCECDEEFNRIYDRFKGFLRQNDKNIKSLAKKLNGEKDDETK